MSERTLHNRIKGATKWSVLTEIIAKLVSPISTMVLARLLAPEAFGVLVTATMVVSFAEIFTDAGFQKYLIQHEFVSFDDRNKTTTVAFWTNFVLSSIIWVLIFIFSDSIAILVGNPGYGLVIAVSAFCIPIEAFSSIQMALYKRNFDFRTLFYVRIVGILVPIFFTIPFAYFSRSYWSLILGMIILNLANAFILTIKSSWKPSLFYDIKRLKKMLSFSIWTLVESICIWLTAYVDIFLVGTALNQYYLGIYRTSMTTVAQITSVIVSAITPVLFSTLSRLQSNDGELKKMFLTFQRNVGLFLVPLSTGIFLFSDLIVTIILGNQWHDAAYFIGWWGMTSAIVIIISQFGSELYRAKGKPRLSLVAQILHLVVLIPIIFFFTSQSFNELCLARSLVRLEGVLVHLVVLFWVFRISPFSMFVNLLPAMTSSFAMFLCVEIVRLTVNINNQLIQIGLAILVYLCVIIFFPNERKLIKELLHKAKKGREV